MSENRTRSTAAVQTVSCALLLLSPFISAGVSLLDAWAIRILLAWFTPWSLTLLQAFALSLITNLLCHQYHRLDKDNALGEYLNGLAYAVMAPFMVLLVGLIVHLVAR